MAFTSIAGTGGYLPKRVMHNREFEALINTSDEWIRERTGTPRPQRTPDKGTTCEMTVAETNRARDASDISDEDIDLFISATTTPDQVLPSTSCILQRRLGIHNMPAFDIHAACAGFMYGLDVADRFIRTGGASCVLLVGADTYSRIIDWTDRSTCVLFGDGAGAVILKVSDEPGVMSTHIYADGEYEELLHVPAGISSGYDLVQAQAAFIHMKGNEIFKKAVSTLGSIALETLDANNLDKTDISWLVPPQANLPIIKAAAPKPTAA